MWVEAASLFLVPQSPNADATRTPWFYYSDCLGWRETWHIRDVYLDVYKRQGSASSARLSDGVGAAVSGDEEVMMMMAPNQEIFKIMLSFKEATATKTKSDPQTRRRSLQICAGKPFTVILQKPVFIQHKGKKKTTYRGRCKFTNGCSSQLARFFPATAK